jgi:hypothetical protein
MVNRCLLAKHAQPWHINIDKVVDTGLSTTIDAVLIDKQRELK